MTQNNQDARNIRKDNPADKNGVLPDGVRGTTRDVGYTQPADEHAGYKDPTKPELRKPSSEF